MKTDVIQPMSESLKALQIKPLFDYKQKKLLKNQKQDCVNSLYEGMWLSFLEYIKSPLTD